MRITTEPSPADAAGWIRELVETGRFAPGQRLPPRRDLATQFRVSRSTVREAIRELVALNILVTRPGAGTYVTELCGGYSNPSPPQSQLGDRLIAETVDELESLVAALAAHDPLRAEAAMIRHLSRLEDAARKAIG